VFGAVSSRSHRFILAAFATLFVGLGLVLVALAHPARAQAARPETTISILNNTDSVLVARNVRCFSPKTFGIAGRFSPDNLRELDLDPGESKKVRFSGEGESLYGDIQFSAHKQRRPADIKYDPMAEQFGFSGFSDIHEAFAQLTIHAAFNWHDMHHKKSWLEKLRAERVANEFSDGIFLTQMTWPTVRAAMRTVTSTRTMLATIVVSEVPEPTRQLPTSARTRQLSTPSSIAVASSPHSLARKNSPRSINSASSLSSIGGPATRQ
jgi:hypothetical protein